MKRNELRIYPTQARARRAFVEAAEDLPEGWIASRGRPVLLGPGGARVMYDTADDPDRYSGLCLTSVVYDEACRISVETRDYLNAQVRWVQ